jgi:hypothetical protein
MSGYASAILRPFGYKGNWLVFAVYGLLYLFFTSILRGVPHRSITAGRT